VQLISPDVLNFETGDKGVAGDKGDKGERVGQAR
jgi:hypothetical protein